MAKRNLHYLAVWESKVPQKNNKRKKSLKHKLICKLMKKLNKVSMQQQTTSKHSRHLINNYPSRNFRLLPKVLRSHHMNLCRLRIKSQLKKKIKLLVKVIKSKLRFTPMKLRRLKKKLKNSLNLIFLVQLLGKSETENQITFFWIRLKKNQQNKAQ